jgi:hypothetical protein
MYQRDALLELKDRGCIVVYTPLPITAMHKDPHH